jgi:hypothetical protein
LRRGTADDSTAADSHAIDDIGRRGHATRVLCTVAAAGLLLYGTVAGSDDMFPFGPFHMYSRYYPANGVITSTAVRAQTADGRDVLVTEAATGIGHGNIEGRLTELVAHPDRLGELASAFHRRFPHASPYVEVRLVQTRWQLHDRAIVDTSRVTLVEWRAP